MSKERINTTEEYRDQAVALLHSSARPLKQVAEELGISANTLRAWRNRRIGARSVGTAVAQGTEAPSRSSSVCGVKTPIYAANAIS